MYVNSASLGRTLAKDLSLDAPSRNPQKKQTKPRGSAGKGKANKNKGGTQKGRGTKNKNGPKRTKRSSGEKAESHPSADAEPAKGGKRYKKA